MKIESKTQKDPRKKIRRTLHLGHLNFEKCELLESELAFKKAYIFSQKCGDIHLLSESLAGLMVCAGENLDTEKLLEYKKQAHQLLESTPECSPLLWYCIGASEYRLGKFRLAKESFFRFLRLLRKADQKECESVCSSRFSIQEKELWRSRTLLLLAVISQSAGKISRAQSITEGVLKKYQEFNLPGINGLAYLILGFISQTKKDFSKAIAHFQKSQVFFLGEHHWYYYLYVLVGHASVSRQQGKFKQANWYLDLVEKATGQKNSFGALKVLVRRERDRLDKTSVDLEIDANKGTVKRSGKIISLRKQHVLLSLLRVLFDAKSSRKISKDGSVSKSVIIEKVWKDQYFPEAHDNKLYYNINRLRKLIESDFKNPKIILNSRDGYRFAPGLKIRFLGESDAFNNEEESVDGEKYV